MDEIEKLRIENEALKLELEKKNKHISKRKEGMVKKATQGKIMSRVPFGYVLDEGKLIPAQNASEIQDIFEEFVSQNISLTQLSKNHGLSVNGLKKILKNFTYIGKVKFNNQIFPGNHSPLLSTTLFNHAQNKLERLNVK